MKYTIINTFWLALLTIVMVLQHYSLKGTIEKSVSEELNNREAKLVNFYADRVVEMQSVIDKPNFEPKRPKTIKDIIDIIGEIAFSPDY